MASFGDVKTAFLHAPLPSTRKVFLRPPSTEPERLWKALKAIYGLREAPRLFQEHLAMTTGWTRLKVEPMIFVHTASGSFLSIFADYLLLICEEKKLEEIRGTIGKDLSIVWGEALTDGSGWH
eukprot:6017967-Heterocapsa_arctica.AAC.1